MREIAKRLSPFKLDVRTNWFKGTLGISMPMMDELPLNISRKHWGKNSKIVLNRL